MPLALVGLAGTLLGTGLDIAGNAESQNAENKAKANEVAQQTGLQKQATATVQKNIAASTPQSVGTELNNAAANRTSAWESLNTEGQPVAEALPATQAGPSSEANKNAASAANSWNNLVSGAAAKEGSFNDLATEQGIGNQNTAEQLGEINTFSAGDARLLPLEEEVASQAGNKLSGWGDIVSSLGNLASLSSIAGTFGPNAPQVASPMQQFSNSAYGITPGSTASLPIPQAGLPSVNDMRMGNFWSNLYANQNA